MEMCRSSGNFDILDIEVLHNPKHHLIKIMIICHLQYESYFLRRLKLVPSMALPISIISLVTTLLHSKFFHKTGLKPSNIIRLF